ncbi:MAG: AMP-binding protein, partial [Novosphingobium sp.]|nr:AMP-binding protein [Novosphingobium sp.]
MNDTLYRPVYGANIIADALRYDLDRPVLIMDGGEELSARQLRDTISRYTQVLKSLSPAPKCAAVLSKNRIEVPAVTTALNFSQTIATALHPMGSVEDYLYVIEDAGVDLLIYDGDHFEGMAAELRQRAPQLKHFIAIGPGGTGQSIDELAGPFEPMPLVAPDIPDPDALARIAYSGGTTGKPKGIICTHRGIAMSAQIMLSEWEWPDDIRHLICAPLSHAGAAVLTPVLLRGGSMVVQSGFNPVAFMQAIEKYRITSTLMVPTMVLALIDHPRFPEFDLSSLESIYYGASAFPPSRLKEAIEKLGPNFLQFYGQSEAPLAITILKKGEHLVHDPLRLASCGRPHPFVSVALLDDDGNEVPDGEPGEICARGPQVMAGYLDKPEETAEAFKYDWLHTGDVA